MDSEFYCDLTVLTADQRRRHQALSARLRPLVSEFQELPDGYAALFESSEDIEEGIREFLVLEKACCPFFTLTLDTEPGSDNGDQTYIVRITGDGDIKPFIRAEFRIPDSF